MIVKTFFNGYVCVSGNSEKCFVNYFVIFEYVRSIVKNKIFRQNKPFSAVKQNYSVELSACRDNADFYI